MAVAYLHLHYVYVACTTIMLHVPPYNIYICVLEMCSINTVMASELANLKMTIGSLLECDFLVDSLVLVDRLL